MREIAQFIQKELQIMKK
jgi:hypothetical protein